MFLMREFIIGQLTFLQLTRVIDQGWAFVMLTNFKCPLCNGVLNKV
jgi:hypothetical protein